MKDDAKYRLHNSIGYQLSITSRLQERRLDEALKEIGLTRIFWCVLLAVGHEGLIHPSGIAQFVGIDRTATSRALRQMEAEGMIQRQSGTSDRRTTSVGLTDKGQQLLTQASPRAEASNAVIHSRLGDADLGELRRILTKLRDPEKIPLTKL